MKCPHCRVEIHPAFQDTHLGNGIGIGTERARNDAKMQTFFHVKWMACPACDRAIIHLVKRNADNPLGPRVTGDWIAYPRKTSKRPEAPAEVTAHLAEDFNEAMAVLEDSPKASAALSRRCLQALLRDQGYQQKDLAPAIDAVLASRALPSSLAANLDAVRNIGNFAAHPMKDTNTGAILPVEPEEAEWNLDVLDGLFDFYYVQPAKDTARIAVLNAKLQAAGKPPMKV